MKTNARILATLSALSLVVAANAEVLFFESRDAFESTVTTWVKEDFEEARTGPNNATTMVNPLDKFSDHAIFRPGEIVDGLRLSARDKPLWNDDLLIVGANSFGAVNTKEVGTANASVPLDITFYNGGINSVGFDLRMLVNPGVATISLFSMADESVYSESFNLSTTASFFGFISSQDISRVMISLDNNHFGVDNVTFGTAVPGPGAALVMILTGFNTYRRRLRRK